jgi:hypothetical protein
VPSQRARGQETQILIVRDGQLEDTLTNIRNFNFEHQLDIQSVGYLGEKSERKDEIVKGVKGDLELHLHSQSWFAFVQAILKRATRETPDVVFNITSVVSFPNGTVFSMTFPDVKFGTIPHTTSERSEYLTVKLEFECEAATPAFG